METNIIVKLIVGENAINKLKNKFLVPNELIENNNTIIFDKNKVKNISMQNRSTSNSEAFSLGVTSLMGSLELKDYDGYLFYLTTNKLIGENVEIQVFDGSTLLNVFYTTKDWQYSNQNKQISIEIKGTTALFESIEVGGFQYKENIDGVELLNSIVGISENAISSYNTRFAIPPEVVEYLSRFHFDKAFIDSGTIVEMLNKFCYATLLVIYESAGKIIIERF